MPDIFLTKKSTADMKSSPPSIKNKKQPSSNDPYSNLHNKSESPQKPETSTKRSKRSSTRNSSASDNAKKRSRTSDEATHRSRPKRRAASSVQIGSYKDMENVDFSLLDHFSFGDTNASLAKSRKKSTRSASAKSRKTKSTLAALKRSALMVSKQSMDPAESPSSETLTTNSTNISADVAATTLIVRKQERARKISGTALENLLPPILLRRAKDGYCTTMPKFLHHLVSSNGRVEIFNRKTGKIMKGEQSVPVKNLVNELQAHSEYEPIIYPGSPRPSSPKSPLYRQARSSTTARVSGKVQPQSSLRASKVVGRTVLITGGSHKGQFGLIDSCIPANWYVISDVFNDDALDLDVVVHSKNLKLVNSAVKEMVSVATSKTQDDTVDESEKTTHESYTKPVTKTIESLRLRVDALEEQKLKLNGMFSFEEDKREAETTGRDEKAQEPPSTPDKWQGRELQRITQQITETRSELQKYKLVRNVLVGRGLNGKSRKEGELI